MKTLFAIAFGLIVAASSALLFGPHVLAGQAPETKLTAPGISVERRDLLEAYTNTCVVRPVMEQVIVAPHSGYIKLLVADRAQVSRGTLLYHYRRDDDEMERQQLQQKSELLESQRAFLQQRKPELRRQQLDGKLRLINTRAAQLRRRIKQARRLFERGELAESKLQELRSALETENANAALERLQAERQSEDDRIRLQDLAYEALAVQTRIRQLDDRVTRGRQAAFDGRVSAVADPLLRDPQQDAPWRLVQQGQPLLTIESHRLVAEIAQVPDRIAALATIGGEITVEQASRGMKASGRLTKFERSAKSRFFRLVAAIPAEPRGWMSGGGAKCSLVAGRAKAALSIPFRYLQFDERGTYVHKTGMAENPVRVRVETGVNDGEYVQITAGLAVGDTVVLEAER